MTGWAEAAHRMRDAAVPAIFGVMGPVGAIGTVLTLVLRQALGQPPVLEYLIAAFAGLLSGMLMIWARWRLAMGRRAQVAVAALAILHALAGAFALRTALGGGALGLAIEEMGPQAGAGPSAITWIAAVYALAMAALLAWCVRVPLGTAKGGTG